MQFKDFNLEPRLQRNLQTMGFKQPMPIQSAAIPPTLQGSDILGSAETGTGKTAAFLLPLLQRLITSPRSRQPRALILVPTRELALQVADQARQLSHGLPLRVSVIYGGVGIGPQEQVLRQGVDVLIATPGRLLDHLARRNVTFTGLKVLVLDEADRMLDQGFWPDIRRIVQVLPRERQTLLFSATLEPMMNQAPGRSGRASFAACSNCRRSYSRQSLAKPAGSCPGSISTRTDPGTGGYRHCGPGY